jgi:hypothetical protein
MNPLDFSWMVGRPIHVSFSEPAAWFFLFGDSLSIRVECPWRLIHSKVIKVSSDDHRQQFGLPAPIDAAERATSLLAGLAVQRVEVHDGTSDMLIHVEQDWRLEIIPFSSGYESWQVSTPSGKNVVAQGGGRLSTW